MPNKKTIYIHLGINKTGSTAIESYCVDYFDKLLQKDITFFPKPHLYKHCWPLYFNNPDKIIIYKQNCLKASKVLNWDNEKKQLFNLYNQL